ncbi:DUF2127 domain-containing protein [Vibrio sp.]|uniref:DUF2127 domain-containing protein n=1 Tax=Vibrio viridaestus TaxID=2487322 RepID=A0A3N9U403_9VIBR|nr:DUF2127 domain-containing protein [Vibrio viridaestus]MDC0610361.1 DUF2127 domain-containing protein [Vibrio sp.]RQW64312.1 DUF2127 domain-containing protein [Vibrio viridaestus]
MSSSPKGLKWVSVLEASKGVIALVLGLFLYKFADIDVVALIERQVSYWKRWLPAEWTHRIIENAHRITPDNIYFVVALCVLYSLIRFVESFGLWHAYSWTEWFALVSGAIYLPFELYEVITKFGFISVTVLLINLVVVGYLYWIIRESKEAKQQTVINTDG